MTSLAEAVLRLGPLVRQLPEPLALPGASEEILELFAAAGLARPSLAEPAGTEQQAFSRVVAGALAEAREEWPRPDPAAALAEARAGSVWSAARSFELVRPDGAVLSGSVVEQPAGRPVLVLGAPGLPLELLEEWLAALAPHAPVAAWRTRGLFERDRFDVAAVDLGVDAQVGDALAVLDHLGWSRVRLLGLCGGAALALPVAAAAPDRVEALSLWLGDFEIGSPEAKSEHQLNLQALMEMAVGGGLPIETLHSTIVSSMTRLSAPDLAPLAVYPYANPALLFDYCRMNSAVMGTDCRPYLSGIAAPAQVVTSTSDSTVHPAGSAYVARELAAPLTEVTGYDHLGIFRAPADCVELAVGFLSEQVPVGSAGPGNATR